MKCAVGRSLLLVLASTSLIAAAPEARGQSAYEYTVLRRFQDPPKNPLSLIEGADGLLYGTTADGGTHGFGAVFKVATNGNGLTLLHEFSGGDGASPNGLIQGADGTLYGTTLAGGSGGGGVVFKMKPDGTAFAKLRDFATPSVVGLPSDGAGPTSLALALDGSLYGTTGGGGTGLQGVVFTLATNGNSYARIHDFSGADGNNPGWLIQASDGLLYGAGAAGGSHGRGVVFKLATNGSAFALIHEFDGAGGAYPCSLIQSSDGALYGTTTYGGPSYSPVGGSGFGVIFKLDRDGSAFADLHDFGVAQGIVPSTLIQGADGDLYGTTTDSAGHGLGDGVVFKIATDGTGYSTLHGFNLNDFPSPLLQGTDGALYGATRKGGSHGRGTLFAVAANGSGFTSLHEFGGADPVLSSAPLIQGNDGTLYGTSRSGGAKDLGTVFKVDSDGNGFAVVHDFTGSDGANPYGSVIQGTDGALYGTTFSGGISLGTVFKTATDGSGFATLHYFGVGSDGTGPQAGLLEASDGDVYGTAAGGGVNSAGTVFRIAPDGSAYATLHDFNVSDGYSPYSALIQGSDGGLYGTSQVPFGGAVFKIATDGSGFTNLHVVGSPALSTLAEGTDGVFYGTASTGGANDLGFVYRLNRDGTGPAMLHDFAGTSDGAHPVGAVVEGSDGALYGTTRDGGAQGAGVIFRLGRSGAGFTKLHEFDGSLDGGHPLAGLLLGADGAFYGTASAGGLGGGVLFRIATQTLSVSDVSVEEGDAGKALAVFTVSLAQAGSKVVTVHYATANGAALASSDYVATSGILTFAPGETSKTVSVMVNGDALYETDETFSLRLSSPINATLATDDGTATILNDDPAPSLSIDDVQVTEGDIGTRSALFTVALSAKSGATTTVHYATVDGTATAGSDYTAVSGTLTFAAGTASKTVSVPVKGDTTFEGTEAFDLVLSDAVNATIADDTGVGTILNDDGAGTFQFSAPTYSVSEAMPSATITVTRVNGKQGGATVAYTTADGTAKASQPDYTFTHGTLTFAANQFSQTFKVPITNDSVHEGNETVPLSLSNPTGPGASLGLQSTAVLTVVDNDIAPTIQFATAKYSVAEKTGLVKLTVKRAGAPTTQGVSFHYATGPGTATGGGTDYTDTSGNLTFAASGAGATTQTISVPITQDALGEGPETFTVTLSAPVNGVLGPLATVTVTIVDDDALVGFSAPTFTVNEATSKATITVKRTGSLLGTLTVHYATSNGTPTPPRYTATSGDLTFNPNVASQSFPVAIVNDSIDEGTQTVNLTLSAPTWSLGTANIVGANPAALSITDNEPTVQFGASAYSVGEAVKSVTISVKRTGSLTGTTTVHYATSDGTATSTGTTPDYAPAVGDLAFTSGQAAKTFPITLYPDTIADGSQTINLALSVPSGAALGTPSTAVVTIKDNDIAGKVQFSATDYSVSEGEGSVTITVTRTGGTSSEATVDYATADDSGIAGTDYTTSSGTLTFGLNEKTKTFSIPILDDGIANSGTVKDVLMTLGTPGNGLSLGAPSSATLWIIKE